MTTVEWILIMVLSHNSYYSGIAIDHFVFNTKAECIEAKHEVKVDMAFRTGKYEKSFFTCIKRSKLDGRRN